MSKNFNIDKVFSLSNLAILALVTLLVTSWFGWSIFYDPPLEEKYSQTLSIESGIFYNQEVDVRKSGAIQVNVTPENDQELALIVGRSLNNINTSQLFTDEQQSSVRVDKLQDGTARIEDIEFTGTWKAALFSPTSGDQIKVSLLIDNPNFAATDKFLLMGVFIALIQFAIVIAHWKQLRYLRLWFKAKRSKRDMVINEELDTNFGHEDVIKDNEQDRKMDTVFGKKK